MRNKLKIASGHGRPCRCRARGRPMSRSMKSRASADARSRRATPSANLSKFGFNDNASSVVVDRGRWEVCEHIRFEGKCVVLRPGSYDSLAAMGLNNTISSVRRFNRESHANEIAPPLAQPNYAYRQRPDERIYQANVTSVRAVVGAPEQRCWVERQQVVEERGGANVPGAILGAVIGGVLGHQVGSGRGQDIATAGGAVAGAAIGANAGRGDAQVVFEGRSALHQRVVERPAGVLRREVQLQRRGAPRAA